MSDTTTTRPKRKGVRVRCPYGGFAPCVDDLCHGGGMTVCGIYEEEVCHHGFVPETCPEYPCNVESGDYDDEDDGRE